MKRKINPFYAYVSAMKTTNIIRLLAGLSFLIFFCPFFDMCSSPLKKEINQQLSESGVKTEITTVQDSIAENTLIPITDTPTASNKNEQTSVLSGYGLSTYLFKYFKEINTDELKGSTFYALLCFTFILIISGLQVILSFKNKLRQVHYLAYINIFLSLVAMLIFYINGTLEVLSQIKFGYYMFLINTIAIIVLCKKAIKQNAV
ncbi:MAG TPA: hypothetical protein VEA37_03730, partial [Flavobacterium sp.]|nr:hypothetical protein [Flavobacterium sp.]